MQDISAAFNGKWHFFEDPMKSTFFKSAPIMLFLGVTCLVVCDIAVCEESFNVSAIVLSQDAHTFLKAT